MLRYVSVGLAVLACLVNNFVNGLYQGFLYGTSTICDFRYPVIGGRWLSHSDPYFYITKYQSYLFIALLIFIIAKLIEKGIVSQFASFLPLILCFVFFEGIRWEIQFVINDPNPYIDLLRGAIYYNWTVFFIVSILPILQIVTVSMSLYKKREAKLK